MNKDTGDTYYYASEDRVAKLEAIVAELIRCVETSPEVDRSPDLQHFYRLHLSGERIYKGEDDE